MAVPVTYRRGAGCRHTVPVSFCPWAQTTGGFALGSGAGGSPQYTTSPLEYVWLTLKA